MRRTVFALFFCLAISFSAQAKAENPDFVETMEQARQGNAVAQYNLGLMYAEGKGVDQDGIEAVRWYTLAAEQGYLPAINNLGMTYDYGSLGIPEDNGKAIYWYRRAAEAGVGKAQFNLARMYAQGEGVPRNLVLAYMWVSLAARLGEEVSANRAWLAERLTRDEVARADDLSLKCASQGYKDCGA